MSNPFAVEFEHEVDVLVNHYGVRNRPIARLMRRLLLTFEDATKIYLRGVRYSLSGRLYYVKPGDWRRP